MADQNQSIDANQHLKDVQAFAQHYRGVAAGAKDADGNPTAPDPHQPVTVAEMAVILETVVSLFQTTGIGVRRNQVGTPMPSKRSWERHG